MRPPTAYPTTEPRTETTAPRGPRAFVPAEVRAEEPRFEEERTDETAALPARRRLGWLGRVALTAGGALVSMALWLWVDQLVRTLFDRYQWLGWAGIALAVLFVVALGALVLYELWSVRRLRHLDHLRRRAGLVLETDRHADGLAVAHQLRTLYAGRPDLARARREFDQHLDQIFDGAEIVHYAERAMMGPLDARARALTAASARRVALVTAVSPRALIDVGFVVYESARLAAAIATLYGARPGALGFFRLIKAVFSHLAVTGGLVLTDGLVEQLVGQGLAARLSARLGEGVVNGLMTVRVGIAAMRVVRPLPFTTLSQPMVRDFLPELANVMKRNEV